MFSYEFDKIAMMPKAPKVPPVFKNQASHGASLEKGFGAKATSVIPKVDTASKSIVGGKSNVQSGI